MGSAPVQGPLWSRAANDWAELQEPIAQPLWEAMLDAGCHVAGAGVSGADAGDSASGRHNHYRLVTAERLEDPRWRR
jgi:hypothetical protein